MSYLQRKLFYVPGRLVHHSSGASTADHLRTIPAWHHGGCDVEKSNWDIAGCTVGCWCHDTLGEIAVLNLTRPILPSSTNLFTPQHRAPAFSRNAPDDRFGGLDAPAP